METIVVKQACSLNYLATMKSLAEDSPHWDFRWPMIDPPLPIEMRFPKLRLINHNPVPENGVLAGLAMGLFLQIDHASNGALDEYGDVVSCQISIKDQHRKDNFHTDYDSDDIVKILGILDPSWDPETMGGHFSHDNKEYPMIPGDFIVFDPRIIHAAKDIKTDRKRFAIDYAIRRM